MPELRPRKPSAAKAPTKEKTPSKRKAAANDDASPIAPKKVKENVQSKKPKKVKRSASAIERTEEQPAIDDENQASEGEDEARALAKVVDSDAEEDDDGPDEEIKDLELPKVPKDIAQASESDDSEPGVVYFIEFAELGVAEIVAKTMDNYLLAGHILKVKMVPKSQIHDKLWVGANRRFKKIPWNKMAGNRLKKPLSESAWTEKISKEETKRNERAKKLLELGYEFEAPKLKSVHDTDDSTPALEAVEDEAPKAIEVAPELDEAEVKQPSPVAKKTAKADKKPAAKTVMNYQPVTDPTLIIAKSWGPPYICILNILWGASLPNSFAKPINVLKKFLNSLNISNITVQKFSGQAKKPQQKLSGWASSNSLVPEKGKYVKKKKRTKSQSELKFRVLFAGPDGLHSGMSQSHHSLYNQMRYGRQTIRHHYFVFHSESSSLDFPRSPKKKNNKKKKNATKTKPTEDGVKAPEIAKNGEPHDDDDQSDDNDEPAATATVTDQTDDANGHVATPSTNGHAPEHRSSDPDTTARLDAMTKEREALKAEVEELRKQLEGIQTAHARETTQLKSELEEVEAAKEQVEEQYQTLVGRVEKIKESVGNRLARGKEELEEANQRIEELEAQNEDLQKGSQTFQEEIAGLQTELQDATRELSSLRSRNNLSQQNSLKEKEDMTRQIQHLREEAEAAKDAMGDWEVLAMEERSIRESLAERTTALEEQLESLRENYERAASERDTQSQAVDSLQRALQEIQEARKKELREMVETSEEQLQAMKKLVQEADTRASEAEAARALLQKELERTAPFEKEVKEKNLLIGKLRHEAIVLNDHLTKALRYLKKTKPEESIDRQIVTNHFLQFLALDRSDPKKFQILQAPSSPSLNTEFFSEPTPTSASKESLADLWAGFLERSAEEGSQPGPSRKASTSSVPGVTRRPEAKGG
ncbi:hypothetical protein CHU98_g3145 [Xylaria longipes]|nr:hypothetical protein CHU98_g3145 [Xylaria longipes]